MKSLKDIDSVVKNIFITEWKLQKSKEVPSANTLLLDNDAVLINATVLYADLVESTKLVRDEKYTFAAEIYKSFLVGCCELIKNNKGYIRAFDGDRVMGVYVSKHRNSNAVKTAFEIKYLVEKIINKRLHEIYNTSYNVKQVVGIDSSNILVTKTGLKSDNDLVWVGDSANTAAKLSSIRSSNYSTLITENVYRNLEIKLKNTNSQIVWSKVKLKQFCSIVYGSNSSLSFT